MIKLPNGRYAVFIPAYNESLNILTVINSIRNLYSDLDLYVIDDGSLDETENIVENNGVKVIKHIINLGGGVAIRTAFAIAEMNELNHIITVDGDGQHDPEEIRSLLECAMNNDVGLVIGSRFIHRKSKREMKLYRYIGIILFSWLISKIIKVKLTDVMSGYRVYNVNKVKDIMLQLKENQYYTMESIIKISRKYDILEVPIKEINRIKGKSKKGFIKYFINLLRILVKNIG
jgi:glycosyltransferase involved in cell wall biosynthesis